MSLAEMLARQQEILDTARRESREMTEDERTEFDNLTRDIQAQSQTNNQNSESGTPSEGETPAEPAGDDQRAEEAANAERSRVSEILGMCRDLGVDDANMLRFINSGASLDTVRSQIIDIQRRTGAPLGQRGDDVEVTDSGEDKFRRAAVDGLLMRGGIELKNPSEGANSFRGMSIHRLAIEILSRETNEKDLLRKSPDDLFMLLSRSFYNPSAAFPSIMDQTVNKAYVEGHKTAEVTFDKFTKKGVLHDFKPTDNNYLAGPAGEFLEVPENGELKADKPTDKKRPQRQLKTFGRQFTMTRQAFINDDIGFITTIPARYAKSARTTQNKQAYKMLFANPKFAGDNKALFHADHGNLVTTGTGVTGESIMAMATAMGIQKNEFNEQINLTPRIIVVPFGYKYGIYSMFYSPTINTAGNTQAVNPLFAMKDQITVVEDSTINALSGGSGNVMPWFMFADPNVAPVLEVDYLDGNEIPTLRRYEKPGVLGFIWDIFLDWGFTVVDFRGAIKNPGDVVDTSI